MSRFRILTHEEAATVPGIQSPQPESLFVVGAVDEHGVYAAIGVFMALCADPLWLRPDKRNGAVLRSLWGAAEQEIAARGGSGLLVTMLEEDPGLPFESYVERLCLHVGGVELKARHFLVPVRGGMSCPQVGPVEDGQPQPQPRPQPREEVES